MSLVIRIVRKHARQFTWFSVIGALVFLLGEAILFVGVTLGMSTGWAFLVQAFVSIEASFVANWKYVFRRDVSFWESLRASFRQDDPTANKWHLLRDSDAWRCFWKFNASRGVFIPLDQIAFVALVWLGMQFLLANVVETAVFTVVNYLVSWLFSFRNKNKNTDDHPAITPTHLPRHLRLPTLAVVIPVKESQRTLRACIASLLTQDNLANEVILVGDVNDGSWNAITDYIRAGLVTVLEVSVNSPGRDANAKRTIGLNYAADKGYEVLALTDSDMVLPHSWTRQGLYKVHQGWQCVAGPMCSVTTGFWPTYVDRNPILPKTPRMAKDYVLDARNFGKRKPPITANVFFTTAAYEKTGGFDPTFVRDYEDYEFFSRMVCLGVPILCTHLLEAAHNHREGFRTLAKDYMASGWGCADFIAFRQESAMAKRRLREIRLVQSAPVLGIAIFGGLLASSLALSAIAMTVAVYGLLASYGIIKARTLRGFAFPFITGIFLVAFLRGFSKGRAYNRQNKVNTTVEAVTQLQPSQ